MKSIVLAGVAAVALALFPAAAGAGHIDLPSEIDRDALALPADFEGAGHEADVHSDNMTLLGNFNDGGEYRMGTDLAFSGKTAVAGAYDFLRVLDISDPTNPRQVGKLHCPGSQNDVSIWKDLVFMSVDSPRTGPECGAGGNTAQATAGGAWEGIRVISIADPGSPKQIAAVKTDCGSHTHTLVPDEENRRVLLYAQSYPLAQQADCNVASHRKISVVEVPLRDPTAARVVSTPDVSPAIGCHDTSVFLERDLAASACLTESQIWDISDRANPEVIAHIANPAINIHHSSAFAWDGDKIAIGDELGGAAAAAGCLDPHLPTGMIWFYDISDPRAPRLAGNYKIPEEEQAQRDTVFCTAHNFNPVPLKDDRDIMVSAWYRGGTTVFDWTDPAEPEQIGYYIAEEPVKGAAWSSYWYNGLIYANNFDASYVPAVPESRGFDVMAIEHDALAPRNQVRLQHLNPQTQEPLRGSKRANK